MTIETLDLRTLGATLPIDRDHPLTESAEGAVVLIRLAPQGAPFPEETHEARETILCLEGRVTLLAGTERTEISARQCCRIPAGLAHRWADESAGLVLVHFGS